jgi:hypothetical protein
VFYEYFIKHCTDLLKGCVLVFDDHKVNMDPKKTQTHISAQARCSRPVCEMCYRVTVNKIPRKEDGIWLVG